MNGKEFGKKLIEVRKLQGLTQEQVAEKCNLTVRTIQRMEAGTVMPRAYTIRVISEELGIPFFNPKTLMTTANTDTSVNLNPSFLKSLKTFLNFKTDVMKKLSLISLPIIGALVFLAITDSTAQQKPVSKGLSVKLNDDQSIKSITALFTNNLTREGLEDIKESVADLGISLSYENLKFDSEGYLLYIKCMIDCNDGYKGSFSMKTEDYPDNNGLGFFRDYSSNAKMAFCTGLCNI